MDDLPIPESAGEGLVIAIIAAVIVGLYLLIRRTLRRAEDDYWERRRRRGPEDTPPEIVPLTAWRSGDPVWVVDGPYAMMKGEVADVRDGALVVTVDVYGRETAVELQPEQVQRGR